MSEQLKLVKTKKELQELYQYIEAQTGAIAVDSETSGVEKESVIIGYSICAEPDLAYYVILHRWDREQGILIPQETLEGTKAIMELLATKKLVMQNAGFDCFMVENNFRVSLMPSLEADTMLMAHILDENRPVGLKELGVAVYGQSAKDQQDAVKASAEANGGVMTRAQYELYKADADIIGYYGAKDAVLTFNLYIHFLTQFLDQPELYDFFCEETMPLLKGPTYDLNTTGLRIDPDKLATLKKILEAEILEAKAFIDAELAAINLDYPGLKKKDKFNIGSGQQLAWLLFEKLENPFHVLTDSGKEVCKALGMSLPYSLADKRAFVATMKSYEGRVYQPECTDKISGKVTKEKTVGSYWKYLSTSKLTLPQYAKKHKWVDALLAMAKNKKLLSTYVESIETKTRYGIIRPSFLQHGTTSGRYSCKAPNFQNLPREDKRVKSCIVSRPGNVFVGADYSQLEPRVFASFSQDERLMACFESGDDFYSVIGVETFGKHGLSLKKDDANSFAKQCPELRNISKVVALSATYGTTAPKMASSIGKDINEAQEVIDNYFESFPKVLQMMKESHEQAKNTGVVYNLFGRPRRMPKALLVKQLYGNIQHKDIPYEYRTQLNLAVNHRIQSTGASIMNRAAIAVWQDIRHLSAIDPRWTKVKIVLQVHDELILEGPEELGEDMALILKNAMENTVKLPGVSLLAEPKIGNNLAELK